MTSPMLATTAINFRIWRGHAKVAMGIEALDVLADRGYFKGEEVLACEPLGITPYVPKPLTSGSKAAGRFGKQNYIPEVDAYRCPADHRLTWRFTSAEKGMTLRSYWTSKCAECPLKTQHDWQGAHGIYFRRGQTILLEGERIKRLTVATHLLQRHV
jgi:hypothetical protein